MKIQINGINDRCENVPLWIQNLGKSSYLLIELPVKKDTNNLIYNILNNRHEDYFSTENQFTQYVNNYFNTNLGFRVNPMILKMIYKIKDRYVYCLPIGCIDKFSYKNREVEDLVRFNRSVAITNNALEILREYQGTIDSRVIKMDELFRKLSKIEYLKKIYSQGNKLKFLEEVLAYYFLYSGSELQQTKPSISKEVLEDMINVSFEYTKDEKLYINPLTFNKTYYKVKESFNPETVNIIVGEPHRLFLEHFLKKAFPEVSSVSKTLDFLKTNENTVYVNQDIRVAEKENLIKF
ncbi:MAG: hypothetical protein WC393_03835 [Candidatus Nanoarchaeia archaeon]|jgi:hypothetical protein